MSRPNATWCWKSAACGVENNPQALTNEQMGARCISLIRMVVLLGWPEEVRHIDWASAQDFYKHHYAPNNAIPIIAGDVTPDQVRVMAQSEYGKVAARPLQPR